MNKPTLITTSILLSFCAAQAVAETETDIYALPTDLLPTEQVTPQRVPVAGTDFNTLEQQVIAEQGKNHVSDPQMNQIIDDATKVATIPKAENAEYGGASPVNPVAISPQNAGAVVSRRDDSMDYLRKQYKSHQVISLKAGGTTTLPISLSTTNRIATSFKHAKFTSSVPSDAALIYSEGGFVYVTPGINAGAVDVIIEEDGAPETAVSMYLVPLNVPPVLVEMSVTYNTAQRQSAERAIATYNENETQEIELAKQDERERIATNQPTANSHIDEVMNLLEIVAKAEVPAGYELLEGDNIPAEIRFPCDIRQMLPLYHEVKQRLIGARLVIDIMEVRNDVNGLRSFRDEACMGLGREDVMAVGVLDKATLAPTESAEVYILRDRTYWERQLKVPRRARVGG
ncbi:hypothetical protein L5M38_20490 [Shewanella sp. SM101]|jgi:conjugal transfer pilus assembly protein TraK|uniref:hypothetical protein n=1 Tax=Shewanella TaxID=22 RepID=UPI0002112D8C|nr:MULTISPECIES: hypothetical protein [Shewanella]AEH16227.1 putative periplasmic protein [Shewanella baltica OS117]MCU8008950.1 hypothetical protein [Shewanella sp. SM87]MCU8106901.1 hypothetical protein [Shewanella sp. SM101]